ncbi:hypothetical protein E3P84_01051 [Wallemia ichthyophaga]|nr:hypothetical protein E3P98_01262 [Wallemia ichthyophaga]TIB36119.1 hypothetical protein E3P84_01051 [Wallemia ichthyophaga]TIB41586.1 hypothetical protein E3P83_01899 [Wallemia ichthyophaga]TIB64304.1 hypothetical protein E3P78_01269 [Wallemia ichthyophaga]
MSNKLMKKQVAGTAGSAVGTTAGGGGSGSYNDGSYHGVGAQSGPAAGAGTGASTGSTTGAQSGAAGIGPGPAAGGTTGKATGGTTGSTTSGSSGSSSDTDTTSSSSSSDTDDPADSSKAPVTAGSTNSGVKQPADDPPANEDETPDNEITIPDDDKPTESEKDASESITNSIVHSMSSSSQSASPTATPSMSASEEEKDEDDNKGLKIALPIILGLLFILFLIWVGKRVVKKKFAGKKNKPTNIDFNDAAKSQETLDEKSPLPPPGFAGAGAPLLDRRGSTHSSYNGAPPLMHANSTGSHGDYLSAYNPNMSTYSFNNLGGQRRQASPVPPYGQHPHNGMSRSMSTNSYQNGPPPPQPQRPGPPQSNPSAPHLPALAIPDPELIPLPSPPPSVYSMNQIPSSPPRPDQQQQFRDPFRDPPNRQQTNRSSIVPPLHIRPPGAVRARVSFKPTAGDELSIQKGEDVQVIKRFSDGWAEVKALASGRTGVIPLQILDDQPTTPMSYGPQSSNSSPSNYQAPSQSMSQPQGFPSAPPSNFQ